MVVDGRLELLLVWMGFGYNDVQSTFGLNLKQFGIKTFL